MDDFDLELGLICDRVISSDSKRVGIQLPEGLKVHATRVVDAIGECSDAEVLIFVDPTYGACDIKSQMCERLDIDLLVHFGHTPYVGGLLKG